MTAPAVDRASDRAGPRHPGPSSGGDIPQINPSTGLSTDYLNHFTEAIMVLEMVSMMPECLDDLRAWQPKSYCEHFAGSRFSGRDDVIAAYQSADPKVRAALDAEAEQLNAALDEARELVLHYLPTPAADVMSHRMAAWLRALAARMASVINGTSEAAVDKQNPQAAIDAMFQR